MLKKQSVKKKIFIGAAWPYANGSLHLGHVAGLIGGDIIARYYRLCANDVLFVSGTDCHGTPIVIEAEKKGIHPSKIAEKYHKEFIKTLVSGLNFSYDCYTKTTTEKHKEVVQNIFLKLYKKGYIYTKTEELPFCPKCKRFLPDRYIEGECPKCHYKKARGDQCDECGNLMNTKELLRARCKNCNNTPEWKSSEHFFLKLSSFQNKLKKRVAKSRGWRSNATKFTLNLLKEGLPDRAITRDTEWGVPIPLKGYTNKRIYVWFEAVCGYLSASKEWSEKQNKKNKWESFWLKDNSIHYYVHGKDNIPFHTIIWPSMLMAFGDLHLPDKIISSEYLTLEKKQFSKSRNWAVWLPDFLKDFDSEMLRYYLIINGPENSDTDFSWKEFQTKINNELVANFGNLAHRTFSLIKKNFPNGIEFPKKLDNKSKQLLKQAEKSFTLIGEAIQEARFRQGLKIAMDLSDQANQYLSDAAPWESVKNNHSQAAKDLAVTAHIIRCLAILLNPFIPLTIKRIKQITKNDPEKIWQYPTPGFVQIADLKPLYKKIDDSEIKNQIERLG
ncbi:methionine--tRNA ligase [Candidatus Parcubacteria bacterium]|nr:methionine--tRNA ligase [Candidatus Parcubacteria bacterium]